MEPKHSAGAAASSGGDSKEAKSWTSSAMEQGQTAAGQVADTLEKRARETAEQQKQAGAEQIGDVVGAMKAAAEDLQNKAPLASKYINDIAGQLGSVASAIRERSVDDMVGNVTEFARRKPVAFFAGAVAAGFALSRLAKSSANREGNGNV